MSHAKNYDELHDILKDTQQACAHDPQPVAGMPFIKRCSKCIKFFGNHEADMIDLKRKKEESKLENQSH